MNTQKHTSHVSIPNIEEGAQTMVCTAHCRSNALAFAASCVLLVVFMAVGCAGQWNDESGLTETEGQPLTADEVVERPQGTERVENWPLISAAQVAPALPGCLDALQNPELSITGQPELLVIDQNEELAVLEVGNRQICVDDRIDLESWLTTGRWPTVNQDAPCAEKSATEDDPGNEKALQPTPYNGQLGDDPVPQIQPPGEPVDGFDSTGVEHEVMPPQVDLNNRQSVSNNPMDDSNPLPPRPTPM